MFKNTKNKDSKISLGGAWGSFLKYASAQPVIAVLGISSVLALALFYLLYSTFLSPAYAANTDYLQKILKKEDENFKGQQVEKSEPQFRDEFKKAALLYIQAQPLLPNETEVANVLAQVQEAANNNNVVLSGLSAAKEAVKSPQAEKLFERELPSTAVGSYDDVVRFLYAVSKMPRILQIRDFAVTSQKDRVVVNFTLFAFNAPPPSEAPKLPDDIQRFIDGEMEKIQTMQANTPPPTTTSKPQIALNSAAGANNGGKK